MENLWYDIDTWYMKEQITLPKDYIFSLKILSEVKRSYPTVCNFPDLNINKHHGRSWKTYSGKIKDYVPGRSWIKIPFDYLDSAKTSLVSNSSKIVDWVPDKTWIYSNVATPVKFIWNISTSAFCYTSYLFGWFPTNSYAEFAKQFSNLTTAVSSLNIHKWYAPVTGLDYSEMLKGIGRFGTNISKYGYGIPENSIYYFQYITGAGYLLRTISSYRRDSKGITESNWLYVKSWNITRVFAKLDFTKFSIFKLDVKSYEFNNWFLTRSITDLSILMVLRYMECRVSLGLTLKQDSIENRFLWGSTLNMKLYLELEALQYKISLETDMKNRSYLNKLSNATWSYWQTTKRYWSNTKSYVHWGSGNKEFDKKKEQGFKSISEDEVKFTNKRHAG